MAHFEGLKLISFVCLATSISLVASFAAFRPKIDPGVFVIQGISTCGSGSGFCMLGSSCSIDSDFEAFHDESHHCSGLQKAFQPAVSFLCCQERLTSTLGPTLVPTAVSTTTEMVVTEAAQEESGTSNYDIYWRHTTKQQNKDIMTLIGNAAANTNKILQSLSKKNPPKSASKNRPHVSESENSPADLLSKNSSQEDFHFDSTHEPDPTIFEFIQNDKSLIQLILQGLNESLTTEPPSEK